MLCHVWSEGLQIVQTDVHLMVDGSRGSLRHIHIGSCPLDLAFDLCSPREGRAVVYVYDYAYCVFQDPVAIPLVPLQAIATGRHFNDKSSVPIGGRTRIF